MYFFSIIFTAIGTTAIMRITPGILEISAVMVNIPEGNFKRGTTNKIMNK